jgi:hypothetical protein
MTVLDNGNVGIGTFVPTNKLMIQNGNYSMSDTGYALGLTTNNFGIISEISGNIGGNAALWIKNDTPSAPVSTMLRVNNNGNIGIGKNPTTTLDVSGNFAVSGTKAFKIKHPLKEGYVIYNNAVESPRCELIFRGKVNMGQGIQLLSGNQETTRTINIDTHVGYTAGTFVETTKNPQCFVNNETSFELVRATIAGNILTIYVNKNNSTDTISWMVIAERDDAEIRNSGLVDGNGSLIPEHEE